MISLGISLGVALLCTFCLTPLAIRWGRMAMDDPGVLALHSVPTPRTGGIAIYGGFLSAVAMAVWVGQGGWDARQGSFFMMGTLIIALTGLWEDIRTLTPKTRLFLEILAGTVVVLSGTYMHIPLLGGLGPVLTVLYLVGAANAMNLLDGMDGLAVGVAGIASAFLTLIALFQGHNGVVIYAVALLGACVGFLPYNFHPARIFMGDTGSLFLGFTLAALSISVMSKPLEPLGFLGPAWVIALPWLDTTLTVSRRLVHHRPLFAGDRSHFYDQLMDRGLSQKQTVFVCYSLGLLFGATALVLRCVPFGIGGGLIAVEVIGLVAMVWKLKLFRT